MISDITRDVLRTVNGYGMNDWALVFGVVLSLGFFCLRGFGSRSGY